MYAHSNSTFSRASDILSQSQLSNVMITTSPLPSTPLIHPTNICQYQLAVNEFDSVHEALRLMNSEVSNNSSSSGCSSAYGSPSSLASYNGTEQSGLIQRSLSSHSLHKNGVHHPVSKLFSELLDSENGPVRKAYSTGDLQRINYVTQRKYHRPETTLSSESNMIIVGMSRACRYSPEEKKERIERYRRRKNQRNFNKKIKYACRKTLADSRPRIRGRFARNEEIEIKNNTPIDLSHMDIGEEEEDDNWINFLDAFSANLVQ